MKHRGERAKALMLIAVAALLAQLSAPSALSQQAGEINGVVTADVVTDGWPNFIAGATIHLYSLERILETKTDVKGHFRLSNVPPGTYELEVAASSFKTRTIEQVKVSSGSSLTYEVPLRITNPGCGPLDSISYQLSPGVSDQVVEGVVVDAGSSSRPVRGVEVRLFHTSDKPTSHQTNESGQFRFSVDQPGRYFIQIVRSGYRTALSQQFWIARAGRTVVTMRQVKMGMLIVCE